MRKLWLLLLIVVAIPAFAERSIEWDRIAVKARLDAEGTLHVREEMAFVFDGAWKGGERVFRLLDGQRLELDSVGRIVDGQVVPLESGDLDEVGHYQLRSNVLRWRSRRDSDPPFSQARITYVLDYAITHAVREKGGSYVFQHNFAFQGQAGPIRRFMVDLALDPVWIARRLPRHLERINLMPGQSVVVSSQLTFTGVDAHRRTLPLRIALILLALALPWWLWRRFVAHERSVGRLEPLDHSVAARAWIERELVAIPPEVAGAAWDERVSSAEISAILARWSHEKKVVSTIEGDELSMELRAPRKSFEGYERKLIDAFFFEGKETSTSALREHYRQSGFNPVSLVRGDINAAVDALPDLGERLPSASLLPPIGLFVIAAALIVFPLTRGDSTPTLVGGIFVMITWAFACIAGAQWRSRIDHGLGGAAPMGVAIALVIAAVVGLIALDLTVWPAHFGFAVAALFVAHSALLVAKSKRGPAAIRFRKRLASARQYFAEELAKPRPAIDDAWLPYIVAFGLDKQLSAWGEEFAAASHTSDTVVHSGSSAYDSSPRWTGGGGAFGGAGATGSWAAAVATVASGVSAESSSSSGGSSDSGGSSSSTSGGGSVGGW